MHFSASTIAFYFSIGASFVNAQDINDCDISSLNCPDGWSANACNGNGNIPNFCCPGASSINRTSAVCCIGGNVFSDSCTGTAITVGSDLQAYSSSVSAALSSASGSSTASSLGVSITRAATIDPVTIDPITIGTRTIGGKTIGGTTFGGNAPTSAPTSTGAAMPAKTAYAKLVGGFAAGAGLLML